MWQFFYFQGKRPIAILSNLWRDSFIIIIFTHFPPFGCNLTLAGRHYFIPSF